MNPKLNDIIDRIGEEFDGHIEPGARNYLEVSIGRQAEKMGYPDLVDAYRNAFAIVPLKAPQRGMKVRIDGRTFVNYAEYPSGIAVPGYVAKAAGSRFKTFVPNDSMICNFT
jgi:hypothetical protein